MKKPLKIVGKVLLWTFGIILLLVLTLPLWIGIVVKPVANAVVTSKAGTSFGLGVFGLNQYSGRLTVGNMKLENPEGCSEQMAVTLGRLHVDVDMGTVLSDTIVIEDISLEDVFVSYVSNDKGENNFAIIQRNATGGKSKSASDGKNEKKEDKTKPEAKEPEADGKDAGKKVIIDHLLIKNVLVQWGPIPLRLPDIELNGIGRKSNGTTMAEAWNEIYASVAKAFTALGTNLTDLGNASVEQVKKTLDAAKAVNVKGMTDAIKGGTDLVNSAAGKTVDAVGESAGKAVDAVSETTGKAVDTLKGLFK